MAATHVQPEIPPLSFAGCKDETPPAAGLIARVNKRQQLSARPPFALRGKTRLEERAVIKFPMANLFLSRLPGLSRLLDTRHRACTQTRAPPLQQSSPIYGDPGRARLVKRGAVITPRETEIIQRRLLQRGNIERLGCLVAANVPRMCERLMSSSYRASCSNARARDTSEITADLPS